MKEGRKPEYPEKTPGDELQKMCTTRFFACSHVCVACLGHQSIKKMMRCE